MRSISHLSRSAQKLLEISSRYSLLKPGMRVVTVDVPYSWLQIISAEVVSTPQDKRVVAFIDKEQPELEDVHTILTDFNSDWLSKAKLNKVFDLAIGYVHVEKEDSWQELSLKASVEHVKTFHFLKSYLKPGASVLLKMFSGFNEQSHFVRTNQEYLSKQFREMSRIKTVGIKSSNFSFYYYGKGWNVVQKAPENATQAQIEELMRVAKAGDIEYSTDVVVKLLGKERGERYLQESSENCADDIMKQVLPECLYKTPKNLEEMIEISKQLDLYMFENPLVHTESEDQPDIGSDEEQEFSNLLDEISEDSDADPDELAQKFQDNFNDEKKLEADSSEPPQTYEDVDRAFTKKSNRRLSKRDFETFAKDRKKNEKA